MASNIEHLECLVDLWYLWTLFATKRLLFAVEMYYIWGKEISMHLSKYEKTSLINRFVKFFENYAPSCFFWELYKLCTQSRITRFRIRA